MITVTLTMDELQAIRERHFAHFRLYGPKSRDQGAIDRRALLVELDAMREQLHRATREKDEWHGRASESVMLRRERDEAREQFRAAEKVAERYWKLRDGDAGAYCVRCGELAHGDELDALVDAWEPKP